jgi:hypothetical protein
MSKKTKSAHKLVENAFLMLPLGSIRPAEWLHTQLRMQANGLTGHLDEFWPDIADSAWVGGKGEGWERGPYWLDGLVPLAFLLDDERLKQKAQHWIMNPPPCSQTMTGRLISSPTLGLHTLSTCQFSLILTPSSGCPPLGYMCGRTSSMRPESDKRASSCGAASPILIVSRTPLHFS